jgi:hypothetical protein
MHRRLKLLAAIAACGTALALTMPTVASASTRPSTPPSAGTIAGSIMNGHRHVFRIRAGRIFDVSDGVRGIGRGDRMALESRYRKHRHHPRSRKRWHVVGTWRLHRGQRNFVGRTWSAFPGFFTLRFQIAHHGHLLRGSQSNRFYVKVRKFHIRKRHKPHGRPGVNNAILSGWDSVQCASIEGGLGGGGVDVIPPFRQFNHSQPVQVYQVSFYSNYSNGAWGPWQVGNALPQTVEVTGADPTTINIAEGSGEGSTPDELGTTAPLDFYGQAGDHLIAWDLEVNGQNGWQWLNPNDLYQAEYYQQYDQNGNFQNQSNVCHTYRGIGFGPRR